MIVAVQHIVGVGNRFHERDQLIADLFGQIVFAVVRPHERLLLFVGQFTRFKHGAVHRFKDLDAFFRVLLGLLGMFDHQLGKGFRVEQFKHGTVEIAHLDHVIRNRGRHAHNERLACKLAFVVNFCKRIMVFVNFYDCIGVGAVNYSVCDFADHLTAFYGKLAVCF